MNALSAISALPPTLVTAASASPTVGLAPLMVQFTGGASGGTQPYSYSWAFGDGATSSSQNPSHTYANPGSYTSTLTVTDSGQPALQHAASSVQITVQPSYSLTINAGQGGFTDPPPGTYYYAPGTDVTLTAYEGGDPCYYFYRWTVDGALMPIGQYNVTVTMNQNHTAIAVFKKIRNC